MPVSGDVYDPQAAGSAAINVPSGLGRRWKSGRFVAVNAKMRPPTRAALLPGSGGGTTSVICIDRHPVGKAIAEPAADLRERLIDAIAESLMARCSATACGARGMLAR